MRRFKSPGQARRFLGTHAAVSNLFNLGRHLVSANHYRNLRAGTFGEWSRAVALTGYIGILSFLTFNLSVPGRTFREGVFVEWPRAVAEHYRSDFWVLGNLTCQNPNASSRCPNDIVPSCPKLASRELAPWKQPAESVLKIRHLSQRPL